MFRISMKLRDRVLKAADGLLSITALPLAIYAISGGDSVNVRQNRWYAAALFLVLCLSRAVYAIRRKNAGMRYAWQLGEAAVNLVSCLLVVLIPSSEVSQPIITTLVSGMLITSIIVNFYSEVKNQPDGEEADGPIP